MKGVEGVEGRGRVDEGVDEGVAGTGVGGIVTRVIRVI